MLDIEIIRRDPGRIARAARSKGMALDVERLLELDAERRELRGALDRLHERRNTLSRAFGTARDEQEAASLGQESRGIGDSVKQTKARLATVEHELEALMLMVPSVPAEGTPEGTSEAQNLEIRRWGSPPRPDFVQRDHIELMELHGFVEQERARKLAGSRSYALRGRAVLLEQAVLRFALEHVAATGFVPLSPPVMVKYEAMVGTGFFPLGREESYSVERDGLFLVGTAEVGLVSLHRDEKLEADELPIRYVGISPCFRREAGAAGRDTRGLYRVHQFNKVEQVVLCQNDPEVSRQEHDRLLRNAEEILRALELPHRVSLACTGELGQGQVVKHEIETWMPSRRSYAETHSCSSLHDFQARRSNIRYRSADGSLEFVHTLNNTAIASPRILIALLENHQREDGSIHVPVALRPYLGAETLEPPRSSSASR